MLWNNYNELVMGSWLLMVSVREAGSAGNEVFFNKGISYRFIYYICKQKKYCYGI